MAKTLTYPERVNRYNFEKLKSLILRGSEKHPGANIVYTNTNGDKKDDDNQ
jgi:DNA-directed RNA polymerase III subunit RPC1